MSGDFADNGDFHANVGIFYMLQICDIELTALNPLRRKPCGGFVLMLQPNGVGRVPQSV
jgi:hypothetical protein